MLENMEFPPSMVFTLQWVFLYSWRFPFSICCSFLLFNFLFQGVMSSSYHVCPTEVTFQFDTTFMYLLAVLMFMKLYQVSDQYYSKYLIIDCQVRHSDVSANAIGVFFGLGVALFLETISIYYSGPWFWAFFCTVGWKLLYLVFHNIYLVRFTLL